MVEPGAVLVHSLVVFCESGSSLPTLRTYCDSKGETGSTAAGL